MKKIFRSLLALGLMGGVALLAQPNSAQAAVTISLSTDGINYTDVASGTGFAMFGGSFGSFDVTINTGNSAGSTPLQAELLSTTSNVRFANGPSDDIATLYVKVTEDTYTMPFSNPMLLNSSISAPEITAGGQVTFQSFLNAVSTSVVTLTGPVSPPTFPLAGASPTVVASVASTPYTLTNITTITLGVGGSADTSGVTTAVATPEPGTMVMAALGAPLLFFGYRRHRRRADSQA